MAELDDVKKAAIASAISAYLSDAGAAALPFSPRMFLRDVKGAGAWGSSSRKTLGSSGYRKGQRDAHEAVFRKWPGLGPDSK